MRQIQSEKKDRNDVATILTVGEWVMFSVTNGSKNNQVWLGRGMSNPDMGRQGVRQNTIRGVYYYQSKAPEAGRN